MFRDNYGEGVCVRETLCNYQGEVPPILTVPYRRGRGVQNSEKLPCVIYVRPLRISTYLSMALDLLSYSMPPALKVAFTTVKS